MRLRFIVFSYADMDVVSAKLLDVAEQIPPSPPFDSLYLLIVNHYYHNKNTMINFEKEIQEIVERNKRVETDKAWETSIFRKIIIAALTYVVIILFFIVANLPNPFINAIVPTLGFLRSTLSLPFFKQIWLKYIHTK